MEVYALIGPSGTGKSTSALAFAYNHHIPVIIDDGLLIYHGRKLAGTSAKYENNYITAIKRATFYYKEHTKEVVKALKTLPITKVLIIGTSDKMVDLIASKLLLGKIDQYKKIENIRSSSEIKIALFLRKTQGKHAIPIPYAQVEQNVFKKMISKGINIFSPQNKVIGETSIVEPNFQIGSIFISPEVLKKIVTSACEAIPELESHTHIKIELENLPIVKLHVNIKASKNKSLVYVVKQIQEKINQDFQQYLKIELYSIDVRVTKLFI